ncbi:hypothetical protein EON81_12555 [bacterium]|nr:MAG: hypothetical protein EON81_12555 [bacterium]
MRTYADAVNWLLKNESSSRFVQTLSEFEKSFGWAKNRRGGSTLGESLRNFVRFSDRPEVQATAERLFRGKLSPSNFGYQSFVDLTDRGMLLLKGYRSQFERLLRDQTVIGQTSYQDGGIAYLIEDEPDTLHYIDAQEEDTPASGKSQAIRACDLAASVIVRYEHMPAFRVFWSPEAKDAAIARILSEFDKGTPLKPKGSLPQEKIFYRLQ